jgi:hypothetical protein
MSTNYCRGLLLEIAGGPALTYPTGQMQYSTCTYGPRILDAQVMVLTNGRRICSEIFV